MFLLFSSDIKNQIFETFAFFLLNNGFIMISNANAFFKPFSEFFCNISLIKVLPGQPCLFVNQRLVLKFPNIAFKRPRIKCCCTLLLGGDLSHRNGHQRNSSNSWKVALWVGTARGWKRYVWKISVAGVPQNHPREQEASSSPLEILFTPTLPPSPPLHTHTQKTTNAQLSLAGQFSGNHETLLPLKKFILVTQHNVC